MGTRGRIPRLFAAGTSYLLAFLAFWSGARSHLRAGEKQSSDQSELTTQDLQPTFKIQVERNLVVVRVVVRDSKGVAVGNLRKDDFRLFDNGKPQTISQFAIELPSAKIRTTLTSEKSEVDIEVQPETTPAPSTPQRYTGLYFDDVHLRFEDIARTRDAADHYLETAVQPGDRVGIFTSSGQHVLDFTDDHAQLHRALFQLRPRPLIWDTASRCPEITPYQAYLMVHQRDPFALDIANAEAYRCDCEQLPRIPPDCAPQAAARAEGEAVRILSQYETQSEASLRGLDLLVRRMGVLPGQRSVVLISPGFLSATQEFRLDEIVDRASRSEVIINALDAKGLFAPLALGDASERPLVLVQRPDLVAKKAQIQLAGFDRAVDALSTLANDTGGQFFHNNNDFEEGFRKVGALPEVYYILAFSPQNLKMDGSFHSLKVRLVSGAGLTLHARHGYFAPKQRSDAAAQEKEEIQQAVFSQDELSELPVEVHTQFFKVNDRSARLSVLTHLDVRQLRFRKQEGRNLNNLTFVTALFDRDGKLLTGKQKLLKFRLLDGTLDRLSQSGITVKTNFDVVPGNYLVREVVREAEGSQLSGLNRAVEIPF
jgi:VWFA-related protein